MPSGGRIQAHAAIAVACLFWGASFIATKVALQSAGPFTVLALRHAVASACFITWLVLARKQTRFPPMTSSLLGRLLVLSVLAVSAHHALQTVGLQYTTAVNASIYVAACPVAIFVLAALMLGESVSARKVAGLLLAIVGVAAVVGPEKLGTFDLGGQLWGDMLTFSSIMTWSLFTILAKRSMRLIGPTELTASVTFLGTLTLLPMAVIELLRSGRSPGDLSIASWAAVGFLGLTCSFLANLLFVFALGRMESQKIGVYLYTIPVVTGILAVAVLSEAITWHLVAGAALVLTGLLLTERG